MKTTLINYAVNALECCVICLGVLFLIRMLTWVRITIGS